MERICEEFDRECNEDEYETKIGILIQSLQSHLTPEEQEKWDDAVLKLCEGDHYLLVLIDAGRQPKIPSGLHPWLPSFGSTQPRRSGDLSRLILVALISLLILAVVLLLFRVR